MHFILNSLGVEKSTPNEFKINALGKNNSFQIQYKDKEKFGAKFRRIRKARQIKD